ncbi:MAG TPA: outer membrane protein assembly factor, partial [Chromatiales bacterium]|nr:outer membrane protein assembly factor [Chromatiales bacterium]
LRARYRKAEEEIRKALEPFGHYRPRIQGELFPASGPGTCWRAHFRIDPGPVVHLRRVHVEIQGPAKTDPAFRALLEHDLPHPGEPLRHARYESLKRALLNLAQAHGYVEARFSTHELRVDPGAGTADIDLVLVSGPRYRFGPTHFEQDVLEPRLVTRFLEYRKGAPFDQALIEDTQRALLSSGYFAGVMIRPAFRASPSHEIPITIELQPAKRHRYAVGLGYATDIGPRFSVEYENRRINRRGHRLRFRATGSPVKSEASLVYTLPHGNPAKEYYDLNAGFKHEVTGNTASDIARVSFGRSDLLPWDWRQRVFLDLSYEDFDVADQAGATLLLMAGGAWNRRRTDDPVHPSRGHRVGIELRGSAAELVSDVSFLQLAARGKWIHAVHLFEPRVKQTRILLRGDAGTTWVDEVTRLPESIRFFAGGDQSVRGFGYKSLGPRNAAGEVIGGRHLVTASFEVDQYYFEKWGQWGLAAFVDAGNAFDRRFDEVEVGAGLGLRWRAPIGGTIRLDVAFALTEPGTPIRIHFTMGPDL